MTLATTPRAIRRLLLTASTLATLFTGCRPDFAPFNRLTSPRVLGMQSEPASPATGETATLSALIYAPPKSDGSETLVNYSWSWCPAPGASTDGYPCLFTHDQLQAVAAQAGQTDPIPSYDLGTGPTATLPNMINPALLQGLCAGMAGSAAPIAPNCDYGFPIQIRLRIEAGPEKTDSVDAVFTTHWRFNDAMSANTNPTIDGINAAIAGAQPITDSLTDAVTLPRDKATTISLDMAEATSETYTGRDDDGNVVTDLRERLFVTWFVETGDTDDPQTSYIADKGPVDNTPFADMLKNKWTPAIKKNFAGDTARLFVVAHDNRGGMSWRSGIVNLESTP
jgi:hypothetical protein